VSNPFSAAERAALRPPDSVPIAEWVERNRVLDARSNAIPGPLRLRRAAYTREILAELAGTRYRKVVLMKPAQWAGSETARNWIAYLADMDPGPTLIVFPDEKACKETMAERVIPMFQESARLRALLTDRAWDLKTRSATLASCAIYVGWSGSPQALASRPIRYLILDEIDKYRPYTGKEADPVSLGEARTVTYQHRAKILVLSTPTIASTGIALEFDRCDSKRHYWIVCRRCGKLTEPLWERVQFVGREAAEEDELRAALARLESEPARLQCGACEGLLGYQDVRWGVQRGQWVSEDRPPGEHPDGESVGFAGTGVIGAGPELGVDGLARKYLRAKLGGLSKLQHFHNSVLGVPFWSSAVHGNDVLQVRVATVWQRAQEGGAKGELPEWATMVVAGVDTAGGKMHQAVVRAYGPDYRSQLLWYGMVSEEQLLEVLARAWAGPGRALTVRRACIDIGGTKSRDRSRTEEVYQFAAKNPAILWPVHGHGGAGEAAQPVLTRAHTYRPPRQDARGIDVMRTSLDTGYFKDLLASHINDGRWRAFPGVSKSYVQQLASERKRLVERKVSAVDGTVVEVWRWGPEVAGAPNHYFDAEVYALAAAYMLGAGNPARKPRDMGRGARPEKEEQWPVGRY